MYETLFRTWYEVLCQYAFSIFKNLEEAEDVVQQVFYKLWDQRESIEINTSVKSYLYRMVHNDCMNRIKQQKLHSEHNFSYILEKGSRANNIDDSVSMNELQQLIDQAISELPPRCREVFMKSRIEQLSYAQIADQLGISTNTVESQMVKALRSLRLQLKEYLPFLLLFYPYIILN